MKDKIILSGVGCCLVDILYNNISFNSQEIRSFFSKSSGDGGLSPGKLVLQEDFELYSHTGLDDFMKIIVGGREMDKINIGGPSVVSLIHAAQMAHPEKCEVRFYGKAGNDIYGKYLVKNLARTPVVLKDFSLVGHRTPSTIVLSDPVYDNGHGERMFINSIGAAWGMFPEDLDSDFFRSDIVVFGGTAIVPNIHNNLTSLLKKAKENNCITVINTVYDFINEKENPDKRWPLGESDETYLYTDILITDKEEARRLSGQESIVLALEFFREKKTRTVIITNGSEDILGYSYNSLFNLNGDFIMPVSGKVRSELRQVHTGDTTGCGDNFAGGFIGSLMNQLAAGRSQPDLTDALSWAVVSGGFKCLYMGGTYFEEIPGEKINKIKPLFDAYKKQLSDK